MSKIVEYCGERFDISTSTNELRKRVSQDYPAHIARQACSLLVSNEIGSDVIACLQIVLARQIDTAE